MKDLAIIKFKDHEVMCNCFMRFQEFYESAEFKGKIVSKEQIEESEIARTGFVYSENWYGFNLPVVSMIEYATLTDLSKEEQELLDFLLVNGFQYVIGISFDFADSLEHEFLHALFYLNSEYREKVLAELSKHDLSDIFKYLKENNYAQETFLDETNAYLADPFMIDGFSELDDNHKDLSKTLYKLFLEYFV